MRTYRKMPWAHSPTPAHHHEQSHLSADNADGLLFPKYFNIGA